MEPRSLPLNAYPDTREPFIITPPKTRDRAMCFGTKYICGDKQSFGIVLSLSTFCELFAELADLDPERSVVLDIRTGTATVGFTFGMGKCLAMRLPSWGTSILRGDGKANDFRAPLTDAGRS